MDLTFLHLIIMTLTVIFVITAGIYSARSVRTASGYSVGGRSASSVMVAGSIAGGIIGGGATIGTSQLAFSLGLAAWWFTLGAGIAFILMGFFYAQKLRHTELETIPDFLSQHYGKKTEIISSFVASLGILFSAVASMLPGIELFSVFFSISPFFSAALFTLITAIYTFYGGMKGAGIGGLLKMGIIWFSLLIAGISAYKELVSFPNLSFLPSYSFNLLGYDSSSVLASAFSMIVGVICTQTYIQAVFSASSPRIASIGCYLAALIVIPVGLPCVAIGLYMKCISPDISPILALPLYLINYTPPFVAAIALGGLLLSLIGSIGGLSLGIGTMLSLNILIPYLHLQDTRNKLQIIRGTVLAILIISATIALLNRGTEVLFWNYLSMALRGGGIFLPFSLAVFYPGHIQKKWVFFSILGSTLASLLVLFFPFIQINPLFIGLLVSAFLLIPGIRIKRKNG